MPLYRNGLPQLSGDLFLTDGGPETTLIFHEGVDLPEFAAFVLLANEKGCDLLRKYYRRYADIAGDHQVGFIFESMTFRASRDWGRKIGYAPERIDEFNHRSIELLQEIRREYEGRIPHMVISACVGPRSEELNADSIMTAGEAEDYHQSQIAVFKDTQADMVTAFTIPYIAEGVGIALAARSAAMPVAIGFTVETDGRLPTGERLKEAIEQVDAATDNAPDYYMINCAHPTHFVDVLGDEPWTRRIRAVRANASTRSHAELETATELDEGDPQGFGRLYLELSKRLCNLNVLGGCCGTDHRHIEDICRVFVNRS